MGLAVSLCIIAVLIATKMIRYYHLHYNYTYYFQSFERRHSPELEPLFSHSGAGTTL